MELEHGSWADKMREFMNNPVGTVAHHEHLQNQEVGHVITKDDLLNLHIELETMTAGQFIGGSNMSILLKLHRWVLRVTSGQKTWRFTHE